MQTEISARSASVISFEQFKTTWGHSLAWAQANVEIVRHDPDRGRWLRANTQLMGSNPLRAKLWQSYKNLSLQQKHLLGSADIGAAIDRIIESSAKCPNLTQLTDDHDDIRKARLFHQSHAKRITRKHDKYEYQSEHDERVTERFITQHIDILGVPPPLEVVAAQINHEDLEDYGVKIGAIALYFSSEQVTRSVERYTTPSFEELKRIYAHLPPEKDILKAQFRRDRPAVYDLYEAWFKADDNGDAITSYIKNMKLGQIFITRNKKRASKEAPIPVFFDIDFYAKYKERRTFNEAIIKRITVIAANDPADIDSPQRIPYAKIINRISSDFIESSAGYSVAVLASIEAFDGSLQVSPPENTPFSQLETRPKRELGFWMARKREVRAIVNSLL